MSDRTASGWQQLNKPDKSAKNWLKEACGSGETDEKRDQAEYCGNCENEENDEHCDVARSKSEAARLLTGEYMEPATDATGRGWE